MSINLGNLELTLIQKINSSTSAIDVQTYSKALEKLRNGSIYKANSFSSLPSFQDSIGALYYIASEETVYFASRNAWISFGSNNFLGFGFGCSNYNSITSLNGGYASPIQESTYSDIWSCIEAGDINSYGLKQDGTLWGWGYSAQGRRPSPSSSTDPTQDFTNSTNWCGLSAETEGGHAIKTDGTLWGWGRNPRGQNGTNTSVSCSCPIQDITSSTNWSRVHTRGYLAQSAIASKTDGTLWTWGRNDYGQLATNNLTSYSSPVQEITSSTNWCNASVSVYSGGGIKTDGTLWTWGENLCGQLGLNDGVGRSSPVQEITSSTNWESITSGLRITKAIKTDGTLWSWGSNNPGQLGDGTTINKSSPVQEISSSTSWCHMAATGYTSYGIKTDGQLWMWGCHSFGTLLREESINYSSPVQDPYCLNWKNVHSTGLFLVQGVITDPYL